MSDQLREAYQATAYKLAGHGPRDFGILKKSFAAQADSKASDMYGQGEVIKSFEEKMASLLGKEKAVFFPSGTMAQQIALRLWCDEKSTYRVAYHPLSHLEIHEQDGLKHLHQIDTILLGEEDRLFTLEDLKSVKEPLAALLIELPQREIGGQLPSFEDLKAITDYCHEHGIRVHLDGARLWECQPFYQRSLGEIVALFDSAYVSFYKGIGGIAGAVLVGYEDFMEDAKIWKRRYGGDLISLYPYIVSADYNYELRKNKMATYQEYALELAEFFNGIKGIKTVPRVPVTNMFHVYLSGDQGEWIKLFSRLMEDYDIGLTPYLLKVDEETYKFEVSLGDQYALIDQGQLNQVFDKMKESANE